jgi:hypothetical protein
LEEVTSSQIIEFVKNPVFLLVAAWLAREMYALSKNKLNSLEESINKLTLSLVRLETQLENVNKAIEMLPKMRGDLDAAFGRIRELAPKSNA